MQKFRNGLSVSEDEHEIGPVSAIYRNMAPRIQVRIASMMRASAAAGGVRRRGGAIHVAPRLHSPTLTGSFLATPTRSTPRSMFCYACGLPADHCGVNILRTTFRIPSCASTDRRVLADTR